ncbi:MAG: hypothetical protein D6795_12445, partial [Deltaproteobacteria bacterium]
MKRERRPSIELLIWPGEIVLIVLAWALWDNPVQGTTVALSAIALFQTWLIVQVFQGYGWKWGIAGILLPPLPIAFFWLDGKLPVAKRLASGFLLLALLLTLSAAAIGKGTVVRVAGDLLAKPEEGAMARLTAKPATLDGDVELSATETPVALGEERPTALPAPAKASPKPSSEKPSAEVMKAGLLVTRIQTTTVAAKRNPIATIARKIVTTAPAPRAERLPPPPLPP